MKRKNIRLSCLLLLAGAVPASGQELEFPSYDDGAVFVGDTVDSEATFVGDSFHSEHFGSTDPAHGWDDSEPQSGATTYDGDRSYVGGATAGSIMAGSEMDGTVIGTGFCDTVPADSCGAITSVVKGCNPHWLRAETLLWFPMERESPSLVARNSGAGTDLRTTFGDGIDSGLAPGYRLDYGHYFGGGRYGVGARVWGLYGSDEDYSESSDGSFDLVRPFFNTALGISDALIIGNTFGPPDFIGSVSAQSELDMIATEAYGRIMLGQAANFHVDMIGGYSFFDIDDELDIRSSTTVADGTGGVVPTGTVRTFRDNFDAENRFHGGQLGFETTLKKGRWSMLTLTKVHLGNMNQRVRIAGSSSQTIPAVPTETYDNGFLVQGQEGTYEQDEFTFIPEVNVKLAYMLRRNVSLSVGYSFVYWNNLALAGNQIDDNLDGTLLLSDIANPELDDFEIRDAGFWMQGIDLGVTIDF